jgi:hypothetical protein
MTGSWMHMLSILVGVVMGSNAWSQTPPACPPNLDSPPFAPGLKSCFSELIQRIGELQKAVEDLRAAPRKDLPVGTIAASYLAPAQFAESLGEREGSSLEKRSWILADGREVTGTRFAIVTNGKSIPDLRGMFVRGIAAGGARTAGDLQEQSTALPNNQFTGITSDDGAAALPRSAEPSGVGDRYNAGGRDYIVINIGTSGKLEPHSHKITVTSGGDAETRPKNVAVYYYIKIN